MDEFVVTKASGGGINLHHKNWIDAIRGSGTLNADVELGCKLQAVISAAEMSTRLKRAIAFDEKTRTLKPA
jgi:hypothetical protein